ncbi:MAG: bifunctional phosphoribosyl-AMP cyclohydrolase/phosphoribosyl-ATP diphosphatase HisIE [Acidimicrobiia bacterium]|nr:bifunctional phosphoribosyl-AMP cyclohydrolase/phosphoribosyl-ATP diphosphatase HisIE [Acidimicrobiia bacterium]
MDQAAVRYDPNGLVPVVVQDSVTAQVLMVAYANAEALAATVDTGEAHFWSRSRNELWRKGATSGNTMRVDQMNLDCDADTVLLSVTPTGPACHTGDISCFSPDGAEGFAALERLWSTIAQRARDLPEGSYTAELVRGGVDSPSRKVMEEATEVVLAAKDQDSGGPDRIAEESADLIYHLLVLLAERGTTPRQVIDVLNERAG